MTPYLSVQNLEGLTKSFVLYHLALGPLILYYLSGNDRAWVFTVIISLVTTGVGVIFIPRALSSYFPSSLMLFDNGQI